MVISPNEERKIVGEFNNLQDMVHWLDSTGIDVSQWGTNSTKTLNNLWDEYGRGEVSFQVNPPMRIVRVVIIIISRDDMILIEVEQVFHNGKRRFRNQPPSEKIKLGEELNDAAMRCLHEELGLKPAQIDFDESHYKKEEETRESPSYPGLMTRYTMYTVELKVEGLPEQTFWRENVAIGEGDPVKRHLWGWHPRP